MLQLADSTIGITGSDSMIGRAVASELVKRFGESVHIQKIPHSKYDLLHQLEASYAVRDCDFVFHCAGYNGNIMFNRTFPFNIFSRTTIMAMNVLGACYLNGVQKVVSPLASCAYPDVDVLYEHEFWDGAPNETVEAHGLAKRNILALCRQIYRDDPQFKYVTTVFNTCYGPHDSFDVNKTKVVGGLISKFVEAVETKSEVVECWGSGAPRRELIYVDDAAAGMVDTMLYYDDPRLPLNIGANTDTSIKELAETIADICGFAGKIEWNTEKPDGQFRKLLNNTRMTELLPSREFTPLRTGLEKTIEWYRENK